MSTELISMEELIARLRQRMKTDDHGCWIWIGCITWNGYGVISVNNRQIMTHRASWLCHVGPIPDGLFVLHKCDVRNCVNPDHLFIGTKRDNALDMVAKGRHYSDTRLRTHCPQGHPYSGKNSRGARICQTCQSKRTLEFYHAHKTLKNNGGSNGTRTG